MAHVSREASDLGAGGGLYTITPTILPHSLFFVVLDLLHTPSFRCPWRCCTGWTRSFSFEELSKLFNPIGGEGRTVGYTIDRP